MSKKKTKLKKHLGYYYCDNSPKLDFEDQKPLVDLYNAILTHGFPSTQTKK